MNLMIPKENIMINKFKHYTLADLGTVITGKTPSTSNPSFWNGNIPFITPKDLQTTKHIIKTERTITDYGRDSIKGCILPKDSISVSCIGNLGYVGKTTKESVTNQQINSIIPNNLVDSDFLYYLLKSMWSYFKHYEGQSTALSILNKTQFEKIQVNIPEDIDVQKKIAGVLSALDDKIELNNQINSNLEQQAQALFKSWFIDFEPFGGKMPNDWEPANVEKAIVLHDSQRIPLSSNQRMNMEKRYPYYGATSIMDFVDNYIFDGKFLLLAEDGTVIDKNDRPVLQYVYGKFWANNHAHVISGKNGFSVEFLYLFFKQTNIKGFVTGAVQPKINQANLKSIPINIPTKNILSEFDVIIQPLFNLFIKNNNENQRLSEIRDSLLPKLISGEIDVSKVDISDLI